MNRFADWLRNLRTRLDQRPVRGPPTMARRAANAPSDQVPTTLPAPLHGMVRTYRADVAGGILAGIAAGKQEVSVGLGSEVDIALLPDDLIAAEVADADRDLVVLKVRWTREGWLLIRDTSNFGVFFAIRNTPSDWDSVRRNSVVRGLAPGDLLGLGSCPGDSLVCRLPAPPANANFAPPPETLDLWTLEERLRVAIEHWRYSTLRLAQDDDAEVPLPEAAGRVSLSLTRDLDEPTKGWALQIHDVGDGMEWWHPDLGLRPLAPTQSAIRLVGPGHQLRFDRRFSLNIPPAVAPVPRFDRHHPPSRADIREVLGLSPHGMSEPDTVKAAWKDAARRLHPDRVGNDPGPTSRFMEARACWEAYRALRNDVRE